MRKVTWTDPKEETLNGEALKKVEESLSDTEVLGDLVRKAIEEFEESITDEELAAALVDADYVVKIPPVKERTLRVMLDEDSFTEEEEVVVVLEAYIDITMVGDLLRRSVQNTGPAVWRKCYPGAFWIRNEKRLADPTTKGQCIGDVRPGLTVKFEIVVPRFPLGEKPDILRIAILEDGVGWHTVEDLRVR